MRRVPAEELKLKGRGRSGRQRPGLFMPFVHLIANTANITEQLVRARSAQRRSGRGRGSARQCPQEVFTAWVRGKGMLWQLLEVQPWRRTRIILTPR